MTAMYYMREIEELNTDPQAKNTRILLLLLSILYKILLDYLYIRHLSVSYNFYGFLNDFSILTYIFSWLVFILYSIVIIAITWNTQTRFSSLFLFVYYLMYFVPFTSMMASGYKSNFIAYTMGVWAFLVIYIFLFGRHRSESSIDDNPKIMTSKSAFAILVLISLLICFSVVYLSWKFTNFRLSFDEAETYVFRVEAFDYKTSRLMGYLYSWSRLIIPLLLCVSIINNRYVIAILLFLLKMLGFGYDGMRLDLLITIIAIGVAFVFHKRNRTPKNLFSVILLAMIGLCITSILEHFALNTGEIDRILSFRVLFLPNVIASWFIRFFETNTPDYFRQSFLRYFGFASPYAAEGLDYIISEFGLGVFGRANNGLVADCMTNFGIVGFAVQPFFVSLWATIIDRLSKTTHISVVFLLAFYFSYCFTNNFFMIILFTNGGFIVAIYLFLINIVRFNRNDSLIDYRLRAIDNRILLD